MKVGFLGLLTLVFITLKLIGVITWSWWLVLLPLYAGVLLVFGSVIFLYVVSCALTAGEKFTYRKDPRFRKRK